jgi:hypothetical protein
VSVIAGLLAALLKKKDAAPAHEEHAAIRYGDEYQCPKCGKAWDVKDDEPPVCRELKPVP